jgi:hypothetical protein
MLRYVGKDTVGMGLDTAFGGATIETAQPLEKEANFADNEDNEPGQGQTDANGLGPPAAYNARRRMSLRPGSSTGRSGRNPRKQLGGPMGGPGGCGPVAAAVQLLSLPQLDGMQRTLKLLDVRMQHVQANSKQDEQVGNSV